MATEGANGTATRKGLGRLLAGVYEVTWAKKRFGQEICTVKTQLFEELPQSN